jgi:hypothetical protein
LFLSALELPSQGKWQPPDAIVFIDAIPRTSVGKFKRLALARTIYQLELGVPIAGEAPLKSRRLANGTPHK